MTPRISLRPAGAAAVLITFVAVVLTLLCVTNLTVKNGVDPLLVSASSERAETAQALAPALSGQKHAAKSRTGSTASAHAVHRSAVQTSERRVTAATPGQSAEIHYPGGAPDVPLALAAGDWFFPADLVDLPVDASAEVIATTVSRSHRGRAPPALHGI